MRILFVETTNATPHLETALELAKRHADAGDEVVFYFIGRALPFTEYLTWRRSALYARCFPERVGASLLGKRVDFRHLGSSDLVRGVQAPVFHDIEELKRYKYDQYHAGLATASSVISYLRESSPDLRRHQRFVSDVLESGIMAYEWAMRAIRELAPERVYTFNGRFANNRAVVDAGHALGVPVYLHERGADRTRFRVEPFLPHEFARVRESMAELWRQAEPGAAEVGADFFVSRREGVEQGWKSFIGSQRRDLLPSVSVAHPGKLVTYFSSSDDEYAAVGDLVRWERWPDQLSAVRDLVSIVSRDPSLHLVIRLHPHLAEKSAADIQPWLDLKLPANATLVRADEPIDTYALIDASDIAVTCGSTVGIESVYWGTPSICLGPSLYSHLDAVHLPENAQELEQLLSAEHLEVTPDRALPYGYYMRTFGERFRFYEANTLFQGRFMGVDLQDPGSSVLCPLFYERVFARFMYLLRHGIPTRSS